MTITYPLSLPETKAEARVRFGATSVVAGSVSIFTGQQQVQRHAGEFWRASIELKPMLRADAEKWLAFLLSLGGRYGTFLMGDPAGATARGTATGTPVVSGAGQTGQSLATSGWTAGVTGILRAGDYIQLGSGAAARLHKVLADANSDGGGLATLDLWPRLRSAPADAASITVANPMGLWRLRANDTDWDVGSATTYGIAFEAVEAL